MFYKMFLKFRNIKESACARNSFLIKLQSSSLLNYYKLTLAQAFSCEFCEYLFIEHLQMTVSGKKRGIFLSLFKIENCASVEIPSAEKFQSE